MDLSIFKDNIFIVAIIAVVFVVGSVVYFRPVKVAEANSEKKIGTTDLGVMYIDMDSVSAVKKDNTYYLIVSAEEKYTDEAFLAELRASEDMSDAVAELSLYMFTNDGRYYCVPQKYIVDSEGKVCADLGKDMQFKAIDDKILLEVYTNALKVLESKNRMQGMMK